MKYNMSERAALNAALKRLDVLLENNKKDLLLKHLHLVIEKNRAINLTRITNVNEAIILHIEDSLSLCKKFGQELGLFCDIGTGAGYPGIPLTIVSNSVCYLLDSIQKKVNALEEFIHLLRLKNAHAVCDRCETFSLRKKETFDTVVARAVSSLATLEEYAHPLLKMGGYLLALKGTCDEDELKNAKISAKILGFKLIDVKEYSIGNGTYDRSLYILKKTSESSITVPRRPGLAKKKPLYNLRTFKQAFALPHNTM